jgi:MFS family permease
VTKSSTWIALRNPVYRNIWFATLISGTWVAAQNTAANWTMSRVSSSPLFLSLMATAASLPFLFFTLPAGALADIVDRRRMMFTMTIWSALAAGGLAICGWLHLINPYVLLTAVFFIGVGSAFYSPASTSILHEIVSKNEFPSATTLGDFQLNISRIVGPLIAGFLLRFVSPNVVFAMNSLCFLLLLFAIYQLKRPTYPSYFPLETFEESFILAIRYVRYAPGIQVVLARNLLFAFFISIIPALTPVVGLKELRLDPSNLGFLFTCMGVGSVVGAVFILPWDASQVSLKYCNCSGKYSGRPGLFPDGDDSRADVVHGGGRHRWNSVDNGGVRALGSGSAGDAKLGQGADERCYEHGYAGRLGARGDNLGLLGFNMGREIDSARRLYSAGRDFVGSILVVNRFHR